MEKPDQRGRKPSLDAEAKESLIGLHARGLTQQECADALNTSRRTVYRVSQELGIEWVRGNEGQDRADNTKARIDRIREKRAILTEKLLDDAEELRGQLFEEYEDSAFVGGQNPRHMTARLPQPKAKDQGDIVRSIESIMRRVNDVLADPNDATDTAASVLGQLAKALENANDANKAAGKVTGVEDDLKSEVVPSTEKPEIPDAVSETFSALDELEAEQAKASPTPGVVVSRNPYCGLPPGECPNKSRPHYRGAGPCIAEPRSLDEAARP